MLSSRWVRTGRIAGRDFLSNEPDAGLNILFEIIGKSSTFYYTNLKNDISFRW